MPFAPMPNGIFPSKTQSTASTTTNRLSDREPTFAPPTRAPCRRNPGKPAPGAVCKTIGIEVILHRNLNRHKRRGFHNLFVLHQKVKALRTMDTLSVPCLRIQQSDKRYIYSFAVDGKDIQKFASISRIGRSEEGNLEGYQRPEILTHIEDIKRYLEQSTALLPNALIIAFDKKLNFRAIDEPSGSTCLGYVDIALEDGKKPGWVVDGQQRLASPTPNVRSKSNGSRHRHRVNWHRRRTRTIRPHKQHPPPPQ